MGRPIRSRLSLSSTARPRTAGPGRRLPTDARLIVAARGIRQFAYGLLAVLLGVALTREGIGTVGIGAIITVSLLGDFTGTYLVGLVADAWGRRRTLVLLALLMAGTGLVFGFVHVYPVLLATAFVGTLGTSTGESAPFLPLEQAMLAEGAPSPPRTGLFVRYNLVASFAGALGALAASLPSVLNGFGLPLDAGIRLMFVGYAMAGLSVGVLLRSLSDAVEARPRSNRVAADWRVLVPRLDRSRGIVLQLAALFSLDAFAGGLVVQSLMALYFHLHFGVQLAPLGVLLFGANLLSALSLLAATRLANAIGLLNTMVFTHLPSNVLLALVPLMPTFPLAAALLLVRQSLSQLDVPTRQAFTMALVQPEERMAAASVTSLARSMGAASSPVLSGFLLQGAILTLGLPFLLAGGLKSAYDLMLWARFRGVSSDGGTGEVPTP